MKFEHITAEEMQEAMKLTAVTLFSCSRAGVGRTEMIWYPARSLYEVYSTYRGSSDLRGYDNPLEAMELYNSYLDEMNRG